MGVSNEKIINKMMEEIQMAKDTVQHQPKMMSHISKVKLLSELLLDEDEGEQRMSPDVHSTNAVQSEQVISNNSPNHRIEELDGTSIFDF